VCNSLRKRSASNKQYAVCVAIRTVDSQMFTVPNELHTSFVVHERPFESRNFHHFGEPMVVQSRRLRRIGTSRVSQQLQPTNMKENPRCSTSICLRLGSQTNTFNTSVNPRACLTQDELLGSHMTPIVSKRTLNIPKRLTTAQCF
jgi:hypothetical protein